MVGVQGHPEMYSEFEAILGYLRPCLKKQTSRLLGNKEPSIGVMDSNQLPMPTLGLHKNGPVSSQA